MSPPRLRLAAAARQLVPTRQGDLDSLCGLYAIINAIRLVLYPTALRRSQLKALFAAGVNELQHARKLRSALVAGMHEAIWTRVAGRVVDAATDLAGVPLQLESLITAAPHPATAIKIVRGQVRRGIPLVVALDGSLAHWTVVVRFTATRLILFDSLGYRWLAISSIGSADDLARHSFAPHGIIALRPG